MSLFKCKMCGGDLEISEGVTIAECEYCGAKQTVPKAMGENLQNLFNRANTLRIKSEFDKAEKLYEKIIQSDTTQSEAYWGLILCKYGIEYVDDPATFKKTPTCHRASYDSIIADDDYKAALENADMSQRAIYEEQAKEIDRIQKDILALAQKEEAYDVFICYKETDANGQRTQDSVIANDIYYQLTNEGFKVFYAAITLEDKLGSAYEPIIFAALNSAKVMLSIGTRPEHFNAVWVKNEWSRFLKIIKKDRSKILIPCYRDMDAYELPEEFAHLQAQDMAKIGFINDIVRGIKKVIKKNDSTAPAVANELVTTTTVLTAPSSPLLKRAFLFLEDGEFDRADDFCEQVLNQDPENAQAYLGKLMAELKVTKQEKLKNCNEPFDSNNNYKKVLRFGDDTLKSTLISYIEHIRIRQEEEHLAAQYNAIVKAMELATSENEYKTASERFTAMGDYKYAEELAAECLAKAEEAKERIESERRYSIAIQIMQKDTVRDIERAIEIFKEIPNWKNSQNMINNCETRIAEIERRMQNSTTKTSAPKVKLSKKKIAIIASPIICAVIAFIIVFNAVFTPLIRYNKAIKLMEAGSLDESHDIFKKLGDYKDSADKAEFVRFNIFLKSVTVGSYISFGSYEQDNNMTNGKEPIQWLVLEIKDGKALLISEHALYCMPFNSTWTDITWSTSETRNWLNNDFLNSAFTVEEAELISMSQISAVKNPTNPNVNPGTSTYEKIFLLNIDEFNKYFPHCGPSICTPTDYAHFSSSSKNTIDSCNWWLRSNGIYQNYVAYVKYDGSVDLDGTICISHCYVRPAIWIDMNGYK